MDPAKAICRVENGKNCSALPTDRALSIFRVATSSAVLHAIAAVVFATVSMPYTTDACVFLSRMGAGFGENAE